MDTPNNSPIIEHLSAYSSDDAAQLGKLLTHLTPKATGEPISQEWLEQVIQSPYYTQIIARSNGKIVGAATLSLIAEPLKGFVAYLESFVVDPNTRGQGIGDLLWQEMGKWCQEKGVFLEFTSRTDREAAHRFYLKHGATIRETTVFRYDPK